MLNLSLPCLCRWGTSWTYKLRRFRKPERWSLPKFLVAREYRGIKFRFPSHLNKLGNPNHRSKTVLSAFSTGYRCRLPLSTTSPAVSTPSSSSPSSPCASAVSLENKFSIQRNTSDPIRRCNMSAMHKADFGLSIDPKQHIYNRNQ
eukprot:GHVQ01012709.1.p1 GENE.GHVQ01012709.1~~GHVQ01012709.1.p1  ORF type:complete len:146 (+),score=16.59 GHVQ01012709.1:306-743(+)